MKASLQLKMGQHLTMTPQLQQAIRLLQLSTIDLQQEIQNALDSNPLLDVEEEYEGDTPQDQSTQSQSENKDTESNESQAQESATDRATNVAIATMDAEMRKKIAEDQQTSSFLGDIFEFGGNILSDGDAVDSIIEWWDS